MSMRYQVHTHASGEQGIYVNAYLVETANGVVAVDAALTVSESRTLRAKLDALGERYRVGLTFNATNLTNRANYGGYSGNLRSPDFREPTLVALGLSA